SAHDRLALNQFACFTSCRTCLRRKDDFLDDDFRFAWVFLQVDTQYFTYSNIYSAHHLGISELGFCLSLELGLSDFDRNHGGKTFAERSEERRVGKECRAGWLM